MTLEFLLTALIVVAVPGAGVVYTLASALGGGARAGTVAAAGCTLGIVPHLAAALLGLAALLHASAVAFQVVKIAGIAYLFYLAWQMLVSGGGLSLDRRDGRLRPSARRIVGQAVLINLLNPKLSIFFLAFLPQFVDPTADGSIGQMALLSLAFMALTFVVFALYGLMASSLRQHVIDRPGVQRWMQRGFAGAFAMLGARLALDGR